jgi:hypothetical protein
MLCISKLPLHRFVLHSVVLTIALSVLPAIKYRFLQIGDVNYMYRLVETVSVTSTYDSVSTLPSSLVGIYQNFPGFVILNVMFIKITGLPILEAYKLLFPVVYGILYPTSFFLLSGLLTKSHLLRRTIVMAAVIPYALLPGAPWNYFMMPNYFTFLLFLPALYLYLSSMQHSANRKTSVGILAILVATITVTHPLGSLCIAIVFSGISLLGMVVRRFSETQLSSPVQMPLAVLAWTAPLVWSAYSIRSDFLQSVLFVVMAASREGLRVPSVTQRLQASGPIDFLLAHVGLLAISSLATLGLVNLIRKKIPEIENRRWILVVFPFLFASGILFFSIGYMLYDIYVGYRLLFLCMIGLTLSGGAGRFTLARTASHRNELNAGKLRKILFGLLLLLILTISLFELYPTEYVNPTLVNPVHTIYEKNVLDFLNAYWASSTQIVTTQSIFQDAQMYSSLNVYNTMVRPDYLPYVTLREPLTTVIDLNTKGAIRANIIYNSGFILVNSTLR